MAPVSDPVVSSDIRMRQSLGLRADAEYVTSLAARAAVEPNAVRGDRRLGALLTETEIAEVEYRQLVIAEDAPRVRAFMQGRPGFGGLIMDNLAGGHLTLALTRDADMSAEDLQAVVGHPDRFRVVTAQHAYTTLERVAQEVQAPSSLPPGVTLTSTSIDEAANQVNITVKGDVAATQQHLDGQFGAGLVTAAAGGPTLVGSKQIDSPPHRGGLNISSFDANASCTSAFSAYQQAPGYRVHFLMTAGHCTIREGDNWLQGGAVPIGFADRMTGEDADGVAIYVELDDASPTVTLQCSGYLGQCDRRVISSVQGLDADVVGQTTCFTGQEFIGLRCGALLSKTETYQFQEPWGLIDVRSGRKVDAACDSGDSGGPALYGNEARGIISAKVDRPFAPDDCVYTHIVHNLRGLGLNLLTS